MIIANTAAQLDDLLVLTICMKQMQGSDNLADLEALMLKCGYFEVGHDIIGVAGAELRIDAVADPVLVITFKFENDAGNEDTGRFYVRVNAGAVTGDF
jgi:hypothetical protein